MHLSSPSEAYEFTGHKKKEVPSNAKILSAAGGVWNAEI
jgi:hypothetical protein